MIDWNKYFDHIYILSGCSNFERRKQLEDEFKRVGLSNYNWWYNCHNELMDKNKFCSLIDDTVKNIAFGHYSIIKTCYDLGYENVLVMEDDIRFLKDINEIENLLNIFLENKDKCDFYFFDYLLILDNIFKFDCIYLNRNAMKYMIYCIEYFDLNIDNYINIQYLYPNNCTNIDFEV